MASVASDVRLVGCTISLGTGPVEPVAVTSETTLLRSEVTSDTILLRSEVIGSPVGSNADPVADSVPDPVTVVASVVSGSRLVGCTTSLGTGPVEAEPVAVTSETMLLRSDVTWEIILPRSEVSGRPVDDCWVWLGLVTVVSVALGVSSDEIPVVVSAADDADGVSAVVSETVVLSAVVAVGASSAVVVVVGASSAVVAVVAVVGRSSSAVLVLEAGGSSVLDATVVALLTSDCASDAVGIKTGPDGPRLVSMSDNERP